MKKRIMILAMILIILLSGCNNGFGIVKQKQEEKNSIKIGVSIYDEYDTFISDMVSELKEWSKKKERETGITIMIDVVSAGQSQLTQNDQIARFADQGYDVVCVNLVDRTDATVIIDKAKSVDMPVVFFNRELVEEDLERWDKLYYVGAIAQQSGEMQGKIVVDEVKKDFGAIDRSGDGEIQYVMLEGEAGHQDALVRTQSSIGYVVEEGYEVKKLGDEIANWNRAQAMTKMNALLKKYSNQIEVIFANDDDMALGAIDALEYYKFKKWPLIVGVNGTEEALEMVKTKKMAGTVYNDFKGQAEAIMKIAYACARKEAFPDDMKLTNEKYIYLPYKIITYENAQQYIIIRED
jgi:methyl-galactoside transport system substrate-binding protein